jgi:hypothetical protein
VPAAEKYCGPQCEAMEDTPDIDCKCLHKLAKGAWSSLPAADFAIRELARSWCVSKKGSLPGANGAGHASICWVNVARQLAVKLNLYIPFPGASNG